MTREEFEASLGLSPDERKEIRVEVQPCTCGWGPRVCCGWVLKVKQNPASAGPAAA